MAHGGDWKTRRVHNMHIKIAIDNSRKITIDCLLSRAVSRLASKTCPSSRSNANSETAATASQTRSSAPCRGLLGTATCTRCDCRSTHLSTNTVDNIYFVKFETAVQTYGKLMGVRVTDVE